MDFQTNKQHMQFQMRVSSILQTVGTVKITEKISEYLRENFEALNYTTKLSGGMHLNGARGKQIK